MRIVVVSDVVTDEEDTRKDEVIPENADCD